jgi:hypothetical protein
MVIQSRWPELLPNFNYRDLAGRLHRASVSAFTLKQQTNSTKPSGCSIQLHEELGHQVCKMRDARKVCTKVADASIGSSVLYFIFAGSRKDILPGLTPDNVNQRVATEGESLMRKLHNPQP